MEKFKRENREKNFSIKLLINKENKKYFWSGGDLHLNEGIIKEEKIKRAAPGDKIYTHLGKEFYVIKPNFIDFFDKLKRRAQVILPKDAVLMIAYAGVNPGDTVVEGGTGSGWLTLWLARAVGEEGRVISYDINKENIEIARENLKLLGLEKRVEFVIGDITKEGFPECNSVFLDIPNSYEVIKFWSKVAPGGFMVFYCPQLTQVLEVVKEARKVDRLILDKCIEVTERPWIIKDKILRPKQWLEHTAFLLFLRRV